MSFLQKLCFSLNKFVLGGTDWVLFEDDWKVRFVCNECGHVITDQREHSVCPKCACIKLEMMITRKTGECRYAVDESTSADYRNIIWEKKPYK